MKSGLIVAIDGPAGTGKSAVARAVADHLSLPYIDTGAMYRAATLGAIERAGKSGVQDIGNLSDDEVAELALITKFHVDATGHVEVDGVDATEAIRGAAVTRSVSRVSAIEAVREGLVPVQRNLAALGGVLEGRDIGTVVFPNAQVKVFLTASVEERARRRAGQLGRDDIDQIASEIDRRDRADSERTVSPLRPADGAIVIDTTSMSVEGVIAAVLAASHAARQMMTDEGH